MQNRETKQQLLHPFQLPRKFGNVEIPQEAFVGVLKINKDA